MNTRDHLSQILFDLPGALTLDTLTSLFDRVQELPDDAVVVETEGASGQITCCIGLACKGTKRRVVTTWSSSVLEPYTEAFSQYIVWHKNILRKYLIPFVCPIVSPDGSLPRIEGVKLVILKGGVQDTTSLAREQALLASLGSGIATIRPDTL